MDFTENINFLCQHALFLFMSAASTVPHRGRTFHAVQLCICNQTPQVYVHLTWYTNCIMGQKTSPVRLRLVKVYNAGDSGLGISAGMCQPQSGCKNMRSKKLQSIPLSFLLTTTRINKTTCNSSILRDFNLYFTLKRTAYCLQGQCTNAPISSLRARSRLS